MVTNLVLYHSTKNKYTPFTKTKQKYSLQNMQHNSNLVGKFSCTNCVWNWFAICHRLTGVLKSMPKHYLSHQTVTNATGLLHVMLLPHQNTLQRLFPCWSQMARVHWNQDTTFKRALTSTKIVNFRLYKYELNGDKLPLGVRESQILQRGTHQGLKGTVTSRVVHIKSWVYVDCVTNYTRL